MIGGWLPRLLLALSALILFAGGAVHAAAFPNATLTIDASQMPPFFVGAYKALWLVDSANLFVFAIVFAYFAARRAAASPVTIMLLALAPLADAALIYNYVGVFFAGHLLIVSAALVVLAGVLRLHTPPGP